MGEQMEAANGCPNDGQTLAWHQRAEIGADGRPRTNGEFIGCDYGAAPAPTCRTCYAQTLSKYERTRFFDAPVTGCIYYCPEHQRIQDDLMARIDWSIFQPAANQEPGA